MGAALSDGKIQIVALSATAPPRVAATVVIQGFSSDIRLELQLNELLQALPGGPRGVSVGIGYQATTEIDERNRAWLAQSFARLEVAVNCSEPLATCIAQVEVGGNPHPVLQGAIGAAVLAAKTSPAEPTSTTAQAVEPEPTTDKRNVIDTLLARMTDLEQRLESTGETNAAIEIDFGAGGEATADARGALDKRIDELASEARPESQDLAVHSGDEVTGPVSVLDGPATRAREASIAELTRQLDDERDAAAAASTHVERLLSQLDVRIDDAQGHADELRRVNALVDRTKSSLAEESSRNEKLLAQIADLEAEVSRVSRKAADAEDERERTERRFGVVVTRNEKLEAKAEDLAEYQVEVFRLNARVSILEDKLDTERKRSKNAQERNTQLRHDLLSATPRPLSEGRTRTNRRVG